MNYPSGESKTGGAECILVSYNNSNGLDKSILLAGVKRNKKPVEIINVFSGDEANDLWKKLTTKNNQEN